MNSVQKNVGNIHRAASTNAAVAEHIQTIFVTNTCPGGYWEDQGYNWFGGC